jgi:hypothetical protein
MHYNNNNNNNNKYSYSDSLISEETFLLLLGADVTEIEK